MPHLPSFQYLAPRSLAEAADLLALAPATTRLLSGGTDLLPELKRGQVRPATVIGLRGIAELRAVRAESLDGVGPSIVIGAGTSLARVASDPLVARDLPVLVRAITSIATPTLRRMGTIGGNLCLDTRCCFLDRSSAWREAAGNCLKAEGDICRVGPSSPRCWAAMTSDLAPVLIALDGVVRLVSARGDRMIPAEQLYQEDGIAHLTIGRDEILADVRVPVRPARRAAYQKLRPRGAFDFPALGVAAALDRVDDQCTQARIVLGAIASRPFRVAESEALLTGSHLDDATIGAAAAAAHRAAHPVENLDLPLAYRRQMVRVFVARAIRQAWYGN